MSVLNRALCAFALLMAMTVDAWAYGGPGAAITLIGSLIGLGAAIFASLFYVILWPLRRMLKRRKADVASTDAAPGTAEPVKAAATDATGEK